MPNHAKPEGFFKLFFNLLFVGKTIMKIQIFRPLPMLPGNNILTQLRYSKLHSKMFILFGKISFHCAQLYMCRRHVFADTCANAPDVSLINFILFSRIGRFCVIVPKAFCSLPVSLVSPENKVTSIDFFQASCAFNISLYFR